MSYALAFAGFTLDGFHELHESLSWRISESVFPRRPGSIAPRVPAQNSTPITLVGDVWKNDQAALESYFDDLRNTLATLGRDRLVKLDNGRFAKVVAARLTIDEMAAEAAHVHRKCAIDFLADEPYWYAASASSQTDNLTGTTATFSITNNGKARTPPIFEIIRSSGTDLADVVLTNSTTSLFLKWSGTLEVGKKLIFDCVNARVIYAGGDAMNSFVPGSINLNLEPGLNNFSYHGAGNVSITTAWHERYS